MNIHNKIMLMEKRLSEFLLTNFNQKGKICPVCLFTVIHDESETCTNEVDKFVYDYFKTSHQTTECRECKSIFHNECLTTFSEASEKFKCVNCVKSSKNKCVICNQSKGVLIEVSNDPECVVHFVCAYLSANFVIFESQNVEIFVVNQSTKHSYKLGSDESPKKCYACCTSILDNDSYFKCPCNRFIHVFCGLYIQAVNLQEEDSNETGNEKFPIFKFDFFKSIKTKVNLERKIIEKLLKKFSEEKSVSMSYLSNVIEENKNSYFENFSTNFYVFEMVCLSCCADQSKICCYKTISECLITMCSICGNWNHDLPECMEKLENDLEILKELSCESKKGTKKKSTGQRRSKIFQTKMSEDSVFVCKVCAHFCAGLNFSLSLQFLPKLKPKIFLTNMIVWNHVRKVKGVERTALLERFSQSVLLKSDLLLMEIEIEKFLKNGQEKMVFRVLKQKLVDHILSYCFDEEEYECIQNEFREKCLHVSDQNDERRYLETVITILGFQTKLNKYSFETVESTLLSFTSLDSLVSKDDWIKSISSHIYSKFVSKLQTTHDYIDDQCRQSTLMISEVSRNLVNSSTLSVDDVMSFLQLKLSIENSAQHARVTSNDLLLLFMKNLTIDSELELFLLSFDRRNSMSLFQLQSKFEEILGMKIWLDQFKQKIKSFVEFYLETLSFSKKRDGFFEKIEEMSGELTRIENSENFQYWFDRLVLIDDIQDSLNQSNVFYRNDEINLLVFRSNQSIETLTEILENREGLTTHALLTLLFSKISSLKIAVSSSLKNSIEILIFKNWTESVYESMTYDLFQEKEKEGILKCQEFEFFQNFQILNQKRANLAAAIDEFFKINSSGFFDVSVFREFEMIFEESCRLNLKHKDIEFFSQNIEFYEQFMIGKHNSYWVEKEAPNLEKFNKQMQEMDYFELDHLSQLVSLRIDKFYSAELFQCHKIVEKFYFQKMCSMILQKSRKPSVSFLKKYCSKREEQKMNEECDIIKHKSESKNHFQFHIEPPLETKDSGQTSAECKLDEETCILISKYTKFYTTLEDDFLLTWNCLKGSNLNVDELLTLIRKLKRCFDKIEINDPVLDHKLMILNVFEVVLSELELMEGFEIITRRKIQDNKLDKFVKIALGSIPNHLQYQELDPEKLLIYKESQIRQLEKLFGMFVKNYIDWKKFKSPIILKIIEKFLNNMTKLFFINSSETCTLAHLEKFSLPQRFLKMHENRLTELLDEMKKYEIVYIEKINFYQQKLETFKDLKQQYEILTDLILQMEIDDLLQDPHIDAIYQLVESFDRNALTSSEIQLKSSLFECITLLQQNNGESFDCLCDLLTRTQSITVFWFESVLHKSVKTKLEKLIEVRQIIVEMEQEVVSEDDFRDYLTELVSFVQSKGIVSCFDYPDFESFFNEVEYFAKNESEIELLIQNSKETKKTHILWHRKKNLKMVDLGIKIDKINEYIDRTEGCMAVSDKVEVYEVINVLTATINELYSEKTRSVYAEIQSKRETFEKLHSQVNHELRDVLSELSREDNPNAMVIESNEEIMEKPKKEFVHWKTKQKRLAMQKGSSTILNSPVIDQSLLSANDNLLIPLKFENENYLPAENNGCEYVSPYSGSLLSFKNSILQIFKLVVCFNSPAKVNLKKVISNFVFPDFLLNCDPRQKKSEKTDYFENMKILLVKLIALLSVLTSENPDKLLKSKLNASYQKIILEEKEKLKKQGNHSKILSSSGKILFTEFLEFFDQKEKMHFKRFNENFEEIFFAKIGLYQKFISFSKIERILSILQRFEGFDNFSQKFVEMFKEVIMILNKGIYEKSNEKNNLQYTKKFRIVKTDSKHHQNHQTSDEQNGLQKVSPEYTLEPKESNIFQSEASEIFEGLCNFIKKTIKRKEDLQIFMSINFDSQEFLKEYEQFVNSKKTKVIANPCPTSIDNSQTQIKNVNISEVKSNDPSQKKTDSSKQVKAKQTVSHQSSSPPLESFFYFSLFKISNAGNTLENLIICRDDLSEFNFSCLKMLRLNFETVESVSFEEIEMTILRGLGFREKKKKTDLFFGVLILKKDDCYSLVESLDKTGFGKQITNVSGSKFDIVCTFGKFDRLKDRVCSPVSILLKYLKKYTELSVFLMALEQKNNGRPQIDPKVNRPFFSPMTTSIVEESFIK